MKMIIIRCIKIHVYGLIHYRLIFGRQGDVSIATYSNIMSSNARSQCDYVAAKATYIRLLHCKIGFLVFFSALAP